MTKENKRTLISCGILKKEIQFLIHKNQWELKEVYLDSSLHVDFDKLWKTLSKSLEVNKQSETLVCYGTCHPLMHRLMHDTGSKRTMAQNCVELALGRQLFDEESEKGAFFLFEDWAVNWDKVTMKAFGPSPETFKHIFTDAHNYFLCINTPCSNNFEAYANKISKKIGLPLKWINIELNHLEEALKKILF